MFNSVSTTASTRTPESNAPLYYSQCSMITNGGHSTVEPDETIDYEVSSMEETVAKLETALRQKLRSAAWAESEADSACGADDGLDELDYLSLDSDDLVELLIRRDPKSMKGYQEIPDNCPQWKRAMIEKRNQQIINETKKKLEEEQQEAAKWKDVPGWKKNLLLEKEKKRQVEQENLSEELNKSEDLSGLPDWKRNLILRKRGDHP